MMICFELVKSKFDTISKVCFHRIVVVSLQYFEGVFLAWSFGVALFMVYDDGLSGLLFDFGRAVWLRTKFTFSFLFDKSMGSLLLVDIFDPIKDWRPSEAAYWWSISKET